MRWAAFLCLFALTPEMALAQQTHCASHDLPKSYQTPGFLAPMAYRVSNTPQGRVLIAEGEIRPGEATRLEQALTRSGAIDEIWFNSPGGAALEGPFMGRAIRKRNLAVRLRKEHACISACSYAFLGGVIRIVEPGAYYGIHMFSGAGNSARMLNLLDRFSEVNAKRTDLIRRGNPQAVVNEAVAEFVRQEMRGWEQEAAQLAATRARYLVEMSLSLDFMTDAFGTEAHQVCYLSQAGLTHYNVANSAS